MSDIVELFGRPVSANADWQKVVVDQQCPWLNRKCVKVRKSAPEISIGTCSVLYGRQKHPIIICPFRLLDRNQVFVDCLHLLRTHEPGNELHIIPEVSIPGGNVDYFLVSARDGRVRDFVGIELQALDTTGTVWPARQKFLDQVGVNIPKQQPVERVTYGMNWKMTAKTTLLQLHHKVKSFETIHKHLVLVIQDVLLDYFRRAFQFDHLSAARPGDSVHVHAYRMALREPHHYKLNLATRLSTDTAGIATCLGLQAEANIELERIMAQLERKISPDTLFQLQ